MHLPTVHTTGAGQGGVSAPPGAAIRGAMAAAAAAADTEILMGGHGYVPLGYPPLRRAIAVHLTVEVLPTQVFYFSAIAVLRFVDHDGGPFAGPGPGWSRDFALYWTALPDQVVPRVR